MNKSLRWRIIAIVVITCLFSVVTWYPLLAARFGLWTPGGMLDRRLKPGLDLGGGVQMVLRVNTDDALLVETRNTADRIDEGLARQGLQNASVELIDASRFRVSGLGAGDDRTLSEISSDVARDFERASGADGSSTFSMTAGAVEGRRLDIMRQARLAVDRRVDALGVAEPVIAVQGRAGDEIAVQLPGVIDVDRAREILGATALLEWKLVERGPAPTREVLLQASPGSIPAGTDVVSGADPMTDGGTAYYLVQRTAAITGRDLRDARAIRLENSQPAVGFSLTRDGARRFSQLTGEHVGRDLAIILDGRVQSAPRIEARIDGGEGYIRGSFTFQEAADVALMLRAGALPASLTYLGGQFVGASLGAASVRAGVGASSIGLTLVGAFMLLYYNRAGLNAVISVAINLVVLLGLLASFGSAVTLPGIAGLVLTIGMGVDSNVLIFERIKEELAAGRGAGSAVSAGFNRVFLTILDTHIASLIAAAFLFQFGTGPIRGFATTLTLGLLANVFTAVFVSRALFDLELRRGRRGLRIESFIRFRRLRQIDFHRWRWHALLASGVVMLTGVLLMAARGVAMGVEFSGGTVLTATFAQPVSEAAVRDAIPGEETVQRFGDQSGNELLIRLPADPAAGEGATLAEEVGRAVQSLQAAALPPFEVTGSEAVGPSIGADLRRKGMFATLASVVGITTYIAMRFRPSFGVGAIAATVHDVVITMSCVTAAGYDLSLNVVAAVLTITGYSVNDTIVTFDRVRENLRAMKGVPLRDVVNAAVNQTLGRTMITAGTTFLAVLALFLFGGDVLRGFAFAMLIGIVSGTYSTIFIASAIATMLSREERRKTSLPQSLM